MEELEQVLGRETSRPEALAALCLHWQSPCFLVDQGYGAACVCAGQQTILVFHSTFIFLWVQDLKTQSLLQHIQISSGQNTSNHLGNFQQEGVKYRGSAPYKNHQIEEKCGFPSDTDRKPLAEQEAQEYRNLMCDDVIQGFLLYDGTKAYSYNFSLSVQYSILYMRHPTHYYKTRFVLPDFAQPQAYINIPSMFKVSQTKQ